MLESARLVSIIREVEEKEIISIIEGLVEEGIRWFEISLSDGENGMKGIRTSRKYFEGRDVYIGAGTVKKKEEIDVLSDMGVPYILTPGFDEQIVRYALEKKIEVLPGLGYKGVAAGSNLVPKHAKRSDLKKIRETARKYVEVSQI